ncbi:MAG: GNAT family N-acyltransferase [Pseudomonadales bacterium]|jgi:putative hemolysin|nr:GNAT family N-acyltransferase [Pseudomonadales bacterium]
MREAKVERAAVRSLVVSPPIAAGEFEVRLARSEQEIRAAQALRYRTLFLERGGRPDARKRAAGADADEWDAAAHHVIVASRRRVDEIVGTLRLVSREGLLPGQRFYTEQAFDLAGLRAHYGRMLEFGRFCIESDRRQGGILLLIWRWTMGFIVDNAIEVMFGCASFPGTDVEAHREILAHLHRNNLAPVGLRPRAIVPNHVRLDDYARDASDFACATRDLPPLLRGYLKLGAYVSDTAIVDPVFNTTFVGLYVDAAEMLAGNTPLLARRR